MALLRRKVTGKKVTWEKLYNARSNLSMESFLRALFVGKQGKARYILCK